MIGIIFSILLIFATLAVAVTINCYAIFKLTVGSRNLDNDAGLGISVVVGLILTISLMLFRVLPWEEINLYLLGAISGIGYTGLELTKKSKAEKLSLLENTSVENRRKVYKFLRLFLKNVGIALLIAMSVAFVTSVLIPKTFFDATAANMGFAQAEIAVLDSHGKYFIFNCRTAIVRGKRPAQSLFVVCN